MRCTPTGGIAPSPLKIRFSHPDSSYFLISVQILLCPQEDLVHQIFLPPHHAVDTYKSQDMSEGSTLCLVQIETIWHCFKGRGFNKL